MAVRMLVAGVWLGGIVGWAGGSYTAAMAVMGYQPGEGGGVYTNAQAALGEPSRQTGEPPWGPSPVTPFNSPYLPGEVVSLGAQGLLVLELDRPVLDDPSHPYGIDFLVFGNSFLQTSAPDYSTATGELGGDNRGETSVSVSSDGQVFYRLDPSRVPRLDSWFPTDGAGDFSIPVDPALGEAEIAGKDLPGLRSLYRGSGGGAGFDLAWAQDERGSNVVLQTIRYVRFDQVSGVAQVDAVIGAGRRPGVFEAFEDDPVRRGWQAAGDGSLFRWVAADQELEAIWDSSRTNSYLYLPLGTVLSKADDFVVGFDLKLESITAGVSPDKPWAFQIALGLIDLASATRDGLYRGVGEDATNGPRNALEFDYFPEQGFAAATVSPALISRDSDFAGEPSDLMNYPMPLPVGEWLKVTLQFESSRGLLRTRITQGTELLGPIKDVALDADFTDFRLDSLAVCSYGDALPPVPWQGGSVLATGRVDNLFVILPPPPVGRLTGKPDAVGWRVEFEGRGGWGYRLVRTMDFGGWVDVASTNLAVSGLVQLVDQEPSGERAFYQVIATHP